jgi:molybdopterin/thiamine biosynthesis adenylyltransferase
MTDRYQRHSLIDWFDQSKVRESRFVVVGAGAVGNEVLKNLALLGVGRILVCDLDRIEEHNLTRSALFRDTDVGDFKANVAARRCMEIDRSVQCTPLVGDFWDALRLKDIDRADAVICCVDNFEARIRLNQLCLMLGTDFYNTGIDSRNATVEAYQFRSSPDCACFECSLPTSVYSTLQKRYSCGWLKKVAYEEKKVPTTAVTSSVAGSMIVAMAMNRLHSHPDAPTGAVRLFQDTVSLHTTMSAVSRSDGCPACSRSALRVVRIAARRECALGSLPVFPKASEVEVSLSEPVLVDGHCNRCHRHLEWYESTRRVDDSATVCPGCGDTSVTLRLVESLSLEELESVFAGRRIPCKYLTFRAEGMNVLVELED